MRPWQALPTPALALIVWSLVVWGWMYATRIPAIGRARIDPAAAREPKALNPCRSRSGRWATTTTI